MKKKFLLPLIFSLILFSCQNSEKNTSDTDTTQTQIVDTTTISNNSENSEPDIDYKFRQPDSNFIYFASEKGIFYLNEFTSSVDTVIKENNIVDFYINDKNLDFIIEQNDNLYFYRADISGNNPQKIFSVNKIDIIKNNTMPASIPEEEPEYYETKIIDTYNESIVFKVYYYTDISEGPYTPNITFEFNFDNSEITNLEDYEQFQVEPFSPRQEETAKKLFYAPDTGLIYDGKIISPDTLIENNYYTKVNYFAVSPDLTRVVWIVQRDWLEGPVYSYYIINLDGSGSTKFTPFNDKFCWIDGNVLVFNNYSLKIIPPDNQEIKISKEDISRFMPKNQETEKTIISVYDIWE